jgi:hypothetical protein
MDFLKATLCCLTYKQQQQQREQQKLIKITNDIQMEGKTPFMKHNNNYNLDRRIYGHFLQARQDPAGLVN